MFPDNGRAEIEVDEQEEERLRRILNAARSPEARAFENQKREENARAGWPSDF
jgi:hypothetical protein